MACDGWLVVGGGWWMLDGELLVVGCGWWVVGRVVGDGLWGCR